MLGLIAQVMLLTLLLVATSHHSKFSWRVMLQPSWFFVAQFVAYFVTGQVLYLLQVRGLLGVADIGQAYAASAFTDGQQALLIFLVSVLAGFFFASYFVTASARTSLLPPTSTAIGWGTILFAICLGSIACAVLWRQGGEGTEMRSEMVKGWEGKALYAVTFLMSSAAVAGFVLLAARKSYALATALALLAICGLFVLGGRGRVMWLLLQSFVVLGHYKPRLFRPSYLAFVVIGLVLVLAALDPIYEVLFRGGTIQRGRSSSVVDFIVQGRTFDSFYNLTLIYSRDLIAHSPAYLLTGSRYVFMNTYFKGVLERGVGYAVTLPGELWLVGGYAGLILGSFAYGVLLRGLDSLYSRIKRLGGLLVYVASIQWLTAPGLGWSDNFLKAGVAIASAMVIAAALRVRLNHER